MSNRDKNNLKEAYDMVQGGVPMDEIEMLMEMDEASLRREWISNQFDLRGLSISEALKKSIRRDWNSQKVSRGDITPAREALAEKYGVSVKTVIKYAKSEEEIQKPIVAESDTSVWAERSERALDLVSNGQASWDEINKACGHDLKSEWIRHKIFG